MADKTCKHTVVVEHDIHKDHDNHKHGSDCGHTAIVHADKHGCSHVDYVHKDTDGSVHLHHECENGENHYHECSLDDFHDAASGGELVTECNNAHISTACLEHIDTNSMCGTSDCDHEAVPHDDHTDYLVPGIQIMVIGETEADDKVIELLEVHCPHKDADGDHCDVRGYVAKAPAPPAP